MTVTTTIRVSVRTRDLLQELAIQSGDSMQLVLDKAIEQYRRRQLLEDVNAAYATLQTDAAAWADLERERAEWDQTLADGLEGI
jgi:predicted transcriptional regulator